MKVRHGFVSNSSSASFLIAIVALKPDQYKELHELGQLEGRQGRELKSFKFFPGIEWEPDKPFSEYDIRITENNEAVLNSFRGDAIKTRPLEIDDIVVYYDYYDEDDSYFWNEGTMEYEYDIELDEFPKRALKVITKINELGGSFAYGAGRNG